MTRKFNVKHHRNRSSYGKRKKRYSADKYAEYRDGKSQQKDHIFVREGEIPYVPDKDYHSR